MKIFTFFLFIFPFALLAQNNVGINTDIPIFTMDIRGTNNVTSGAGWQLATPGMTHFMRMYGGQGNNPNPFLAFNDQDTFNIATTNIDWSSFLKRLTILPDGKIGINNESPLSKLDIQAVGNGMELLRFTTDRPWVFKQTQSGINTTLTLQSTVNDKAFNILSENGLNRAASYLTNNTYSKVLLVPEAGEVGIGVTEADAKLHIKSNSSFNDPQLRLTESSVNDYTRIKMENELEPGIFWDIAGRADSIASESRINFYYFNQGFSGDKMTLTGEGNVGIGTTTPGNRLRVNGSTTSSQHVLSAGTNYSGNVHIRAVEGFSTPAIGYGVGGYFLAGFRGVQAYGSGGTASGTVIGVEAEATGSAGTRIGILGRATGGATNWAGYFDQGNVYTENNLYVTGSVGIGTSSPGNKLRVNGSTTSSQHVFSAGTNYIGNVQIRAVEGFSTPASGYGIGGYFWAGSKGVEATGSGGSYSGTVIGVQGSATGTNGTRTGIYGTATGGSTNWAGYFDQGNVYVANQLRIGADALGGVPGYTLMVDGKVIAEEMRVQLSFEWPDYVFEEHYHLPSLSEVESFIQEAKHLPNIPTAKDVKENGLLLGEMQKRMMEKIEELTLYVIDLDKQNQSLVKKVTELENKIKTNGE